MNPARSNDIQALTPEENGAVFLYRQLRSAGIKPLITRPGVLTGDQEAVLGMVRALVASHAEVYVIAPPPGDSGMPKLIVHTPVMDMEFDVSHHLAHRIQTETPPEPIIHPPGA